MTELLTSLLTIAKPMLPGLLVVCVGYELLLWWYSRREPSRLWGLGYLAVFGVGLAQCLTLGFDLTAAYCAAIAALRLTLIVAEVGGMRLLDRYIIRSFLVNYLLAFAVVLGMYVLLDLIINFDRFTKAGGAGQGWGLFLSLAGDVADYYAYQLLVIFQLVSGVIPLLAAGFTMWRMTRHQELTAMLASGVSLYRVATPIVLCAMVFSALVVIDQELLMPQCAEKLLRRHDEVSKTSTITRDDPLYFVRDINNSLFTASGYDHRKKELTDILIIDRDKQGCPTGRTTAAKGVWVEDPPPETKPQMPNGAWKLTNVQYIDDSPTDPLKRGAGAWPESYYGTTLKPDQLELVFSKKAVEFLSSRQLQDLAANSPDATQGGLIKIMHMRFSQPIMNLILLLVGIPYLLTRVPGRLVVNMLYCIVVAGGCFVGAFVMFQMAGTSLHPVLGAWLPVLLFGPFAIARLDSIKT